MSSLALSRPETGAKYVPRLSLVTKLTLVPSVEPERMSKLMTRAALTSDESRGVQ